MYNYSLDFDFYENFVYGKHNQVRFPSSATRVEGILQLVHNDVFGPVLVAPLGKYAYYVSFIDDFSRNTHIYFLRNKFEVFERFKYFKALVENQVEKRIKAPRTDSGGKFYENEFEYFFQNCGIERHNPTPYKSQHNGVAERMNKTKMKKKRCMLSGVGLGKESWVEEVGISCYLGNQSPSSTLDDKTPYEVCIRKKPSLTHLRVFFCEAYVHVPKENMSNLDSK
jgi:hypothetical protein